MRPTTSPSPRRPRAGGREQAVRRPGRLARARPRSIPRHRARGHRRLRRSATGSSCASACATCRRRRGRAALIVAGLMLGTAIITAALATGDTMSQTIRSVAISALGPTDEVVAAKGIERPVCNRELRHRHALLPAELRRPGREGRRRLRPRRRRRAGDRRAGRGAGPDEQADRAARDAVRERPGPDGGLRRDPLGRRRPSRSADLRPGEIYLNAKGAEKLDAKAGDTAPPPHRHDQRDRSRPRRRALRRGSRDR